MEKDNTFTKMLKLTNKYTIGVHMLNNGFFKLYCEDKERIFTDNQEGYNQAIQYMESLK